MNKNIFKYLLCCVSLTMMLFQSCQDPWKDQEEMNKQISNQTILDQLASNPNLTVFYELLQKSGVVKRLEESRSFTVWAPSNTALNGLSQSLINDQNQLILFVENHIAYQSYFTRNTGDKGIYINSLNGKKVLFGKNDFEEHNIQSADNYLKNGVLHIIDGYAIPKLNAIEYLSALNNKHYKYVHNLEYNGFDVSKGVILYYDPITNNPVYQDGSVFPIRKNQLFEKIADMSSEDSLMTYIILNDSAYEYEFNQLERFNQGVTPEKTDTLTQWHVVKDLIISGIKQGADLNDSLVSVTGVKLKINQSDILETKKLSNGIAYLVSKVNYELLKNKIPIITIQGVNIDSLRVPNTTTHKILKDFSETPFIQIENASITSSPSPLYYYRYKTNTHSSKYAVYARVRNALLSVPFSMSVAISFSKSDVANKPKSPYFQVPVYNAQDPNTLKEIYVGEVDIALGEGNKYVFLFSSEGATSALPTALALNYLKLIPIN